MEEALNAGIDNQAEVKESINETFYHYLASEAEKLLRESISNTEAELYAEYQNNPGLFEEPLQINLQRLVVSSEDVANKLRSQLLNGADFTKLVAAHTTNNEDRFTNGELGYSSIKTFGYQAPKLAGLKVGEVSEVIPYHANEFHIYKCLGLIQPQSLSFSEARDKVDNYLKNKKFRELRSTTIEQVKAEHNATVDIEKLNELIIQI
jgi:foldase protein PrsA